MSIIRKSSFVFLGLIGCFLLTGCLQTQGPEEKIYEVLEEVSVAEKDFEEQQDPIAALEEKEKKIFDKIIGFGAEDQNEINKLSDEALGIIEERKTRMEKEQKSIVAARKQLTKMDPLMKEISDKSLKKQAKKLYDVMMERYKHHDDIYSNYTKGLQLDEELYAMLKNKDVEISDLEKQLTKVNEAYEKVRNANKKFNENTNQFNDLKIKFYKNAGINIKESTEE